MFLSTCVQGSNITECYFIPPFLPDLHVVLQTKNYKETHNILFVYSDMFKLLLTTLFLTLKVRVFWPSRVL